MTSLISSGQISQNRCEMGVFARPKARREELLDEFERSGLSVQTLCRSHRRKVSDLCRLGGAPPQRASVPCVPWVPTAKPIRFVGSKATVEQAGGQSPPPHPRLWWFRCRAEPRCAGERSISSSSGRPDHQTLGSSTSWRHVEFSFQSQNLSGGRAVRYEDGLQRPFTRWCASVCQEGPAPGGALCLLTNQRHNRLKILYWDSTGLWILSKTPGTRDFLLAQGNSRPGRQTQAQGRGALALDGRRGLARGLHAPMV